MKKRVAKIVSLALVLVCMLSLVACGGGSSAAGTYRAQSFEAEGESLSLEDFASLMQLSKDDIKMDLELKSNGNFTLDLSALGESTVVDGTWKLSGKTLTLTAEGDSMEATLDGDTVTMSMGQLGLDIIFKKQ